MLIGPAESPMPSASVSVTNTVSPGARNPEQARGNAAAADLALLDASEMEHVRAVYEQRIAPYVHQRW